MIHFGLKVKSDVWSQHQGLKDALKKITYHLLAEALEKHEQEGEMDRINNDPDLLEILYGGKY